MENRAGAVNHVGIHSRDGSIHIGLQTGERRESAKRGHRPGGGAFLAKGSASAVDKAGLDNRIAIASLVALREHMIVAEDVAGAARVFNQRTQCSATTVADVGNSTPILERVVIVVISARRAHRHKTLLRFLVGKRGTVQIFAVQQNVQRRCGLAVIGAGNHVDRSIGGQRCWRSIRYFAGGVFLATVVTGRGAERAQRCSAIASGGRGAQCPSDTAGADFRERALDINRRT